ncbi:unnamed protein product [Adineta steineri]|uniref:Dynein heavy chain ATP-binding dynein motor region domain-containing protein n=1 Tax=Adineta steineri TaxID=433720 RepID=A0A813VA63_9BILA|nr:unnamed protein product [Adineta steineri]CAF1575881.1 unnamed protein product [Adineta steineri]
MKEDQLKSASELNQILSRELERTSKIFETSVERQSTSNGTCAIASTFQFIMVHIHMDFDVSCDQIYYEWLSDGVLLLEMENYTIIIKSIEYPSLLIDPFGQYDQWMGKCYNLQKIHFDNQLKHDVVMSIEQSFLSGSKIYIKNCNTLDSLLYPLAQWKATSHESNSNDDSNLIIYYSRCLYCNTTFRFYFHTTCDSLDKVSSSL